MYMICIDDGVLKHSSCCTLSSSFTGKKEVERGIGAYAVLVNRDGWSSRVVVDNYLPVIGKYPSFAKDRESRGELWVAMLEKAYAKLYGNYSNLTAGFCLDAFKVR